MLTNTISLDKEDPWLDLVVRSIASSISWLNAFIHYVNQHMDLSAACAAPAPINRLPCLMYVGLSLQLSPPVQFPFTNSYLTSPLFPVFSDYCNQPTQRCMTMHFVECFSTSN
ncbi:hypothetical protein Droror1_Dr00004261 [Drosera rotundifolia]